jgi:hypothetical protein
VYKHMPAYLVILQVLLADGSLVDVSEGSGGQQEAWLLRNTEGQAAMAVLTDGALVDLVAGLAQVSASADDPCKLLITLSDGQQACPVLAYSRLLGGACSLLLGVGNSHCSTAAFSPAAALPHASQAALEAYFRRHLLTASTNGAIASTAICRSGSMSAQATWPCCVWAARSLRLSFEPPAAAQ